MKRPGRMSTEVLKSLFKKPVTSTYPLNKSEMPDRYRGKIIFHPELCIGCKMCVRDCPSNAIIINSLGDKKFEAVFNLAKCIYCAQCVDSCMKKALESTKEFELAVLDKKNLKVIFSADAKKDTKK